MSWKDRSRAAKPPGRSRRVGSFRSSFRAATLWEPPWGQATRRTLDPWRSSLQPSADRSPQGRDAQLGHPSPSSSPPLTAALPGTDRPTREVWTLVVHPSSVDRRPPQGAWPFDGPVSPCSSPGGSAPPGALVFLHGGVLLVQPTYRGGNNNNNTNRAVAQVNPFQASPATIFPALSVPRSPLPMSCTTACRPLVRSPLVPFGAFSR